MTANEIDFNYMPKPDPWSAELDKVPEPSRPSFPTHVLPPAVRNLVEEGSRVQGVDVAFWAVPALAVLAGCVGATRRARIRSDFREPCIIWSAVVAPSGAGKSPPLRALLRPVREHDRHLHERTQRMVQAAAEAAASRSKSEPAPPPVPQLAAIVSDVTLEALAVRLGDNPRGLLLAVDELAGWLRSQDRYRKGGDEQGWLQLHGGDQLKVDRKTAGSVCVQAPAVSICGTIQPGIAAKYLADEERRSSGSLARMLLAAPPLRPARLVLEDVPDSVHRAYEALVSSLLRLELDTDGKPIDLPLRREALEAYREWFDANGHACHEENGNGEDARAAAMSKLRGYVPRIALLLSICDAAEVGKADTVRSIGEDAILGAIEIVDWHEFEMHRLYDLWDDMAASARVAHGAQSISELAARIFEILGAGPKTKTQINDALGGNIDAGRIDAALTLLREQGKADYEVGASGPRGGRRPTIWHRIEGVSP